MSPLTWPLYVPVLTDGVVTLRAHTPADLPARPKGGAGQGARAVLGALPALLGL